MIDPSAVLAAKVLIVDDQRTTSAREEEKETKVVDPSDVLAGKILIVDDQSANVLLLERMLRGAGYMSVTSTQDPHQVVELHQKNRYDLILLDLQMPGRNGFQVLKGLQQVEPADALSVLVMTAHPGNKDEALQGGARDFIAKPFDAAQVLARVYNMLELRLLERRTGLHTG
jgi:CheY-like chemotaxis protein